MSSTLYGTEFIDEPSTYSKKVIKKNISNPKFLLILIVVCFVILLSVVSKLKITYTESNKSLSVTFPYTLNRSGYEPSQFFQENCPSYFQYAILSDSVAVIEPYADMYLYIKSNAYMSDNLDYYHFSLCSDDNTCDSGYSYPIDSSKDTPINLKCSPKDQFTFTINAMSTENKILSTSSGLATCMYVRREIRDLTDEHLTATMEAMHELWELDQETGKKLYGDSYLSAKNLLEIHYFQASWRDTDHSHEGLAFLPHHLQMTNFFESSVQLVDPSITVPLWDYTRDSVTGKDVSYSPMFTNKTFGSIQPPKIWKYSNGDKVTDGAVPDGLWALQIIEENTRFPDMKSGYSYMRSPWSSNPSPYMSRFTNLEVTLPTCKNHYDSFNYDPLSKYLLKIETDAHGTAHFAVGGVLGCDILEPLVDEGVFNTIDDSYQFCLIWVLKTKFWYRDYTLQMQSNCYVENNDYSDHNNFKCGFECDNSDEGKETFYNLIIDAASNYLSDTNTDTLEKIRLFICGGDIHKIVTGDPFISSSASDPAFWPIHPTLERLLHAKLMTSGFSNTEYPDSLSVCVNSNCYAYDTEEYGTHKSCCDGHFPNHGLFDYVDVSRDSYIGLTNVEFLDGTNPTSKDYSMPYIYDNFDWSHCADVNDIDSLLANLAK